MAPLIEISFAIKVTYYFIHNQVDSNRTCYRLVGGVLIERTVGEVLPALQKNHDHLSSFVGRLNTQMIEKGKSIASYREKNNIQVRGEGESNAAASSANNSAANVNKADGDKASQGSAGVLVN